MKDRQIRVPGPDHPITIERNPVRVVVSVAGRVIADTRDALTLRESTYPPVQYIPLKDVDMSLLEPTDHSTYCPYKGDCAYYIQHPHGRGQVSDFGRPTTSSTALISRPVATACSISSRASHQR